MLGFIIQRLLQAFVVMMVISFLVFLGVYAIGNPIDVLISPDADQRIREMVIRQYGLDLPLWQQYLGFLQRLVARRFRPLVRLQHAGSGADPLAPAGDAGAHARGGASARRCSACRSACMRATGPTASPRSSSWGFRSSASRCRPSGSVSCSSSPSRSCSDGFRRADAATRSRCSASNGAFSRSTACATCSCPRSTSRCSSSP